MKAGTNVMMSPQLKSRLARACVPGMHVGPFDPEDPADCWGCSLAHVEEFGDCMGTVQGPTFDSPDAPEVDVVWSPSGLRYAYHPVDLVEVGTYDPTQRAREKQASRDQDEADLASGKKTRDDLRRENGAFTGLNVRVNIGRASG